MEKENYKFEIKTVRDTIVNYALVLTSVIGSILLLLVLLRDDKTRYTELSAFYILTAAVLMNIVTSVYRKSLSLNFKVLVFSLLIVTVISANLLGFGFFANAKAFIVIFPVFLSLILSYKKALLALFLLIVFYLVFGFLYSFGYLTYNFNVKVFLDSWSTWLISSGVILLSSWAILYVGHFYGKVLIENYGIIKKQNIDLKNSEEKYRLLYASSNDGIMLIRDNRYTDCNTMALDLFKCEQSHIIDYEPWIFSPLLQPDGQDSKQKARKILEKVLLGEPQIFDWQHIRPNGELFDVSVSLNLMILDGVNYIQAVLRDITEKKQIDAELEKHRNNLEKLVAERTCDLETANEELKSTNEILYSKNKIIDDKNSELKTTMQQLQETQLQLIQAEKMASLGILTAGVAHEINNPLNFIMGGYIGLDNYFNETGEYKDKRIPILLNSIKSGVDRASDIVKGLNQFSRNNETLLEDCDIHSILNNCLVMLNNQLKERIEVNKDFCNEEIKITGNVGKLHQVFINILTNSIQAIDKKGFISIKTNKQKQNSIIEITDSGCGISKNNLTKITDPFYTTKEPGKGTGLGLSIAYNVIQNHNGNIEFQSELNEGMTVIITLPNR